RQVDLDDILLKAMARDEEIQPYRRSQIAELHSREEHDPEVDRVDPVLERDGHDQRDDENDRREYVEYRAEDQQEHEQREQERIASRDILARELEQPLRDSRIDEIVGRCKRHAENDQYRTDEHHRFPNDARHLPPRNLP